MTGRRFALLALVVLPTATGCVRRTVTITSDPPGALVWLNDREIGRTPVTADFVYYGTYDVRLQHPDYEPMMTSGDAASPWWDTVGLDFFSELVPGTLHAEIEWHYVLEPLNDDPEAVRHRAEQLRARLAEAGDGEAPPQPQGTEP